MRGEDESVTNPFRSARAPALWAIRRSGRADGARSPWDGLEDEGRYDGRMRALLVVVCSWLALVATAAADDVPTCGAVSSLPVLDRYDALVPGARVRLALRWDATSRSSSRIRCLISRPIWADGPKIEWDAKRMQVKGGSKEYDSLIRPVYRPGWTL